MLSAILSGDAGRAGVPVLLILAKVTLVLLAALAATRLMERGSAVARHLVWFVSLAALLMMPVLASWSPLRVAVLPPSPEFGASSSAPAGSAPTTIGDGPTGAPANAGGAIGSPLPQVEATVNTVREIVSPDTPWFGALSDPGLLVLLWISVAMVFAGWLAAGAISVRRIIHRSRPLDSPEWRNPLWEVADRLGLEEAPRLVRSDDAKMPFACGLLRPTIVLPAESDGWTLDRRRAVLLHELAHVRRRDLVGHAVGRLACAVYWFHPLVWTAARRLRSESERACDDLALTCGARASDYAEHLLDIVTGVRHHATPAVALAMARRKEFEGRMLAILDPELRRGGPSRAQTVGIVGALAVLCLVVGAAAPVARAADGRSGVAPLVSIRSGAPSDSRDLADGTQSRVVRAIDRRQTEPAPAPASRAAPAPELGPGTAAVDRLTAMIAAPEAAQGRPDDRPALLANVLRTDTSATLRRIAAWGLAQYADADVAVEALTAAVRRDSDPSVREMAAWALADARGGDSALIGALSTALRGDASSKVRASAAWALGNIADNDAMEALTAALADTSRAVRLRAAWAIGNIEPREAPRGVIEMLSDGDAEVRQMAAWVLYSVEDPEAVPALDAALQRETDKETQHAFIRALAATGEKSVDAIKRLIDSKDAAVRATAIRALAGGGAGEPWPWPWPDPRPQP